MCMNAIGSPTSKTIIDDILYYINHNYRENLKLETIAPCSGTTAPIWGKSLPAKWAKPSILTWTAYGSSAQKSCFRTGR